MAEKISTLEVRRRIGALIHRVSVRHDEFIIERKGKALAALVPIETLKAMRLVARRHALGILHARRGGDLSGALTEVLAGEGRRWARRGGRRK